MKYAFLFVNYSREEDLENLDVPKVFAHKKDAMKEFEKRKAELLESYEGFEDDIRAKFEEPGYFSFCDYDGNNYTIYVKKVKVKE
jgi:hypothetical protein